MRLSLTQGEAAMLRRALVAYQANPDTEQDYYTAEVVLDKMHRQAQGETS